MLDQLRVFFCVVCGGKGSSGGAEPHPYNGPRGACVIINAISVFHSRGEHCSPAKALWCRMAFRVEQSPTPTMGRERCV